MNATTSLPRTRSNDCPPIMPVPLGRRSGRAHNRRGSVESAVVAPPAQPGMPFTVTHRRQVRSGAFNYAEALQPSWSFAAVKRESATLLDDRLPRLVARRLGALRRSVHFRMAQQSPAPICTGPWDGPWPWAAAGNQRFAPINSLADKLATRQGPGGCSGDQTDSIGNRPPGV